MKSFRTIRELGECATLAHYSDEKHCCVLPPVNYLITVYTEKNKHDNLTLFLSDNQSNHCVGKVFFHVHVNEKLGNRANLC